MTITDTGINKRKGLIKGIKEYGLPPMPTKSHSEIKENYLIGKLKDFLDIYQEDIKNLTYVGLNGVAKKFYSHGWNLYNDVLKEGYALNEYLEEDERETLFLFVTQANEEYAQPLQKVITCLSQIANNLQSEVNSGRTLKSILEN